MLFGIAFDDETVFVRDVFCAFGLIVFLFRILPFFYSFHAVFCKGPEFFVRLLPLPGKIIELLLGIFRLALQITKFQVEK